MNPTTMPEGPAATATAANPERDDQALRIESLEERIAEMESLLTGRGGASADAVELAKSRSREEWYEAQAREISKGNVVRTQEEADRRYPKGENRYRCVLSDGNRHPEIIIRADNEIDAQGRYAAVCGILNHEKPITTAKV